jgi:tetrahydromethanopterin S-methyltransferase subunit C
MGWNTAFLVLGIIAGILGIWNLARQRNIFLSLTGILWFLVVLFRLPQLEKIYNYELASGVPAVGNLVLFLLIPIFIIFAFFTSYRR